MAPLVEQYMRVKSNHPKHAIRAIEEQMARQLRRVRARCAQSIFDIDPPASFTACFNPWILHFYGDQNVARTDVFPDHDRAVLILSSNSGPVAVTGTTGMTAHLLKAWDSAYPANFGGDIHGWWAAYYMVPTVPYGSIVDFNATGAGQYMNWYSSDDPLPSTGGTYGDGVNVEWNQGLFYGGSGVLDNATSGSLSSRYGDMVQTWTDFGLRTFDDHEFYMTFEQMGDFNRTQHTFNAIPGPLDWHLWDVVDDGEDHTVNVGARDIVTPGGFPGAARALATHFAIRFRALCP